MNNSTDKQTFGSNILKNSSGSEGSLKERLIKKIIPLILAFAVIISVFSACGVKSADAPAETSSAAPIVSDAPAVTPALTPSPTPVPTPEPFGLPNVYLFVLDEYSSFDILSQYYGYDAKIFDDYLDLRGFNISRESYSTDNQTEHSMCDLLNMDYLSRHYSKSKCFDAIEKAKLYKVFADLGYSQFQLSTSNDHFEGTVSLNSKTGKAALKAITTGQQATTENHIPEAVRELLKSEPIAASKTKVDTAALNEWGFYPSDYIRDTKRYSRGGQVDDLLNIFDYFENPANYPVTSPRVTYCYMSAAHVPFVFDEFGGIISSGFGRDWRDTYIYLNQYKFINKHLMATCNTIINNDPDSIIIIMSDHGIRYHADCKLTHKFYITDKDSLRIMNAVYIKGGEYDIEGLSAINTMRYILNIYEGLNYPPIEDPVTKDSPENLKGIIPKHR